MGAPEPRSHPQARGDGAPTPGLDAVRLRLLRPEEGDLPRELSAGLSVHSVCTTARELFSRSCDVAVLLYRAGSRDTLERLLQDLQEHPTVRLVILSPLTPDAARELASLAALDSCSVVWECEGRTAFVDALARAGQDRVFSPLRRWITRTEHVPPIVAAMVRRVCDRETVVRSVRSLAKSLGVAESTLRYHWRSVFPGSALRKLIDWALLIKVLDARGYGGCQPPATSLGTHPRTFQRLSQRLLGMPLSEALRHQNFARDLFHQWTARALSVDDAANESVDPRALRPAR